MSMSWPSRALQTAIAVPGASVSHGRDQLRDELAEVAGDVRPSSRPVHGGRASLGTVI
jgi:hypothetical protein